jgi:polyisoprenyl-phosphate glycosyltransferase
MISVVSPVYRADVLLPELVQRVSAVMEKMNQTYEIILVEDHSPDNSWAIIKQVCRDNRHVRGLKLSRNFGQHYAITAGLHASKGEWVVVIDCDLQDVPEEIPNLYAKALEGYFVVQARRHQRQDSILKRQFSRSFYGVLSWLTGTRHDPAIANFGIYHRKVIDAVCSMSESIRYFPTMVKWVGFRCTTLDVKHSERKEGKSSYNFRRLMHLAMDIILANSDKPLRLTVKLGVYISMTSFLFALYSLIMALAGEINVPGYASIMVSIWFLSGLIIFILGVVGLYVGKTFEGVKKRPVYIVEEMTDH